MGSILEDESAATKLRQQLRAAYSNELKLLCGLGFFERFTDRAAQSLEGYFREFVPMLATLSQLCDPAEFLHKDQLSLASMIALLEPYRESLKLEDEYGHLTIFARAAAESQYSRPRTALPELAKLTPKEATVAVTSLFVEDYFYLAHESRGRLLTLYVTAETRPPGNEPDEIDFRNPVDSDRDPFLEQARKSIMAARAILAERFGLHPKKRYRIEISVNHHGARFTGDSLGVAIAVGAIAAISKVEPFRERLSISPDVAFTGALSSDGILEPIDSDGLRRKIHRAYFSDLKCLIVPRDHITEAWEYLKSLELSAPDRPGGRLELAGAEKLGSLASDPRLLPVERLSFPTFIGRKLQRNARTPWIEIPALIVLLALFGYLFGGKWLDPKPVRAVTNVTTQSLDAFNARGNRLWSFRLDGPFKPDTYLVKIQDLEQDGKREVLWMPITTRQGAGTNTLYCFEQSGTVRFVRSCAIMNQYPNDTLGFTYDNTHLSVIENLGKKLIITEISASLPGRGHIRLWSASGDSLGWYVNAGGTYFCLDKDIDGDGSKELFFENYNNRMRCTALLVLRADSTYGVSPPYTDSSWDLTHASRGNQLAYLLFPRTDLSAAATTLPYNQPSSTGIYVKSAGILRLHTTEAGGAAEAMYDLDFHFRVKSVNFSDQFLKRRDELVSVGMLKPIPWDEYTHNALMAVTYWTDTGWVTEGQLRASGK